MKKSLLFLMLILSSMLLMVSCRINDKPSDNTEPPVDNTEPPTDEHTHTYDTQWSYDADYHWHQANCEHNTEVSQKGEHVWVETERVNATCTTEGSVTYTCFCGKIKVDDLDKVEHNVDDLEYQYDDTKHWQECTSCNPNEYKEDHTLVDTYKLIEGEVVYLQECVCGYTISNEMDSKTYYSVKNEDDLRLLLTNGYNVKLGTTIVLTSSIFMTGNIEASIDLNHNDVLVHWVDTENYAEVFRTDNGAILNIYGNGNVDGGSGSWCNGAVSTSGGVINIYGGYYTAGLTADGVNGSDLIYARSGGVINIYGGTFEATPFSGVYYTLDILESEEASSQGKINVYGGSFVNFDPSNHNNDGAYSNKVMVELAHVRYYIDEYGKTIYYVEDHTFEVTDVEVSCKNDGYTLHLCHICEYEYKTNVIPALPHDEVIIEARDVTCDTDGYTEGIFCESCQEYVVEPQIIPAPGHNIVGQGHNDTHHWDACSNCTEKLYPTTHSLYEKYKVVDGDLYHVIECARCDYEVLTALDQETFYEVDNENDLRILLTNGYNVVVVADINLTSSIFMTGDIEATVNLKEHTIKVAWVDTESYAEVFRTDNGAILNIIGKGTVDGGSGSLCNGAVSTSGGVINIYGGTFKAGLTADGVNGSDLIYARSGGVINIYGGVFDATAHNGKYYTLDILESEEADAQGKIYVYGGDYYNFDPSNHTNDGAYSNKLVKGYHVDAILFQGRTLYIVSEHNISEHVEQPTCEADGYVMESCTCGYEEIIEVLPTQGHDYVIEVFAAGCEYEGLTVVTCNNCMYREEKDFVDALGHDYQVIEVVEVTCLTDGYSIVECSHCHHSYETEYVIARGYHVLETNYNTGDIKCDSCEEANDTLELGGWHLAGGFNSWSFKDMYKISDTVVRVDYELKAGTYQFKVVEGASWGNAYGNSGVIIGSTWLTSQTGWEMSKSVGGNCTLEALVDGVYTFEFNLETKCIYVSGPMSVVGTMDEAEWAVDHYMTYQGNGVYTVELDLKGQNYYFKVRANGAWDNSWGNNFGADNATLEPSGLGTYILTVDFINKTMELKKITL